MAFDAASREFRISAAGLELGMYVSRLDRPWLGTGFPLEGVKLTRDEQIDRLQSLCAAVYVDVTLGRSPALRYVSFDDAPVHRTPAQDEIDRLHRKDWQISRDFDQELVDARGAHENFRDNVHEVMQSLQDSGRLDADKLTHGIDTMLASVTRNPSALPWIMEMRRKGTYVYQHALGCAIWAAVFGRHLGLEFEGLRDLALGGLLCDVGKVRLSTEVLNKSEPWRDSGFHPMRGNLAEGGGIVADTPGLSPRVLEMVTHHHERHDGSGYPRGLRGNAIPIFARIAGLIDSYDAMTGDRPYAPTLSPHQAVMELYESRDRLFQAELVEQFIRSCGIYPTGSLVELTDGTVGVVLSVHSLKRLRPCVMLLMDSNKRPFREFRPLDLSEVLEDAHGQPLNIRCSLPQGSYGIDRNELFLD